MDRIAQQVENVECSIAFLQQEHQMILTSLQLETLSLKKRCNELSCDLSKMPPVKTREDFELEEDLLQTRLLKTEQHLAEQESTMLEQCSDLRKKAALAKTLQVRLRDEERRFLEELKRRSHKITTLSRDLRKQTDVAAQLSFQLHSAHFHLYHQTVELEQDEEKQEDGVIQETDWAVNAQCASQVTVDYASQIRASGRTRRWDRVRECVPRERIFGPEEPGFMPDPALFLYPFRHGLLPLHRSHGRWKERGFLGLSEARLGRIREQPVREDIGPETTDL